MLSFNLRLGDDVWFGKFGAPFDSFQQIVLGQSDGSYLTVLTPTEVVDIPLNGGAIDSGLLGVRIAVKSDPVDDGLFSFGIDAPDSVQVMRGRVYRRKLNVE